MCVNLPRTALFNLALRCGNLSSASAKLGAVASPKKTIIEEGVGTPSILPCTTEHGKTSFERLKIRFNQAVPMVDQIVEHVATALAMGALRPEERLPPIEAAAKYTHVGTSTMRDAYLVLAKHGLSCNTATGSYFTSTAERAACRYLLSRYANGLIEKARSLDLADEEIIGVVLAALTAEN